MISPKTILPRTFFFAEHFKESKTAREYDFMTGE
jgi:hypothetical protein